MSKISNVASWVAPIAFGAILRRPGWETPSDVLFVAGAAVLVIQAVATWHADRQKIAPPALAIREPAPQQRDAPDIRPLGVFADDRTLKAFDLSGTLAVFPFSAASVLFRNFPTGSHPNAEAPNVLAYIRFLHKGQTVLDVSPGRWGDSKEPSMVKFSDPGASLFHLNAIPFRIGEDHELNITVKFPEDGFFYAFNNDSYSRPLWRHDGFRLDGDVYEVIVTLVGPHVGEEFHFTLRNLGQGKGLDLAGLTPQI
jgi:hypothetical protein